MNKFVNIVKFSMVSALTAGLTMGTVVESAEALVPSGGWSWSSVTNAGNDPTEPDEQNIGFDLLRGKSPDPISDTSTLFEGAVENFFYKDLCGNNINCNNLPGTNEEDNVELKFAENASGNLRATLLPNTAKYEILSNDLLLEVNGEDKTNILPPLPQPVVLASFELDTSGKDENLFITSIDTILDEFDKKFSSNNVSGSSVEILPDDNPLRELLGGSAAPSVTGSEGNPGTFVISEIFAKEPVKTTPEPGNIVSLLALGTLGAGALHRRKIRINSNK
jgi:hypothetical protein